MIHITPVLPADWKTAIFSDARSVVLRRDTDRFVVPTAAHLQQHGVSIEGFAPWNMAAAGLPYYAYGWQRPPLELPDPALQLVPRREMFALLTPDEAALVGRLYHLSDWDLRSRHCGRCGAPTTVGPEEVVKRCTSCEATFYPTISPAVIMAVVDTERRKLLMAHANRGLGRIFSVLAGFVEPGESLEQCVAREVLEEAGVQVRNVQYFASQPWAFPGSLMIAFTAEYAQGDLRAQPGEIEELGWYGPDALPEQLPIRASVAHRLIEWFVQEYGTQEQLRALW